MRWADSCNRPQKGSVVLATLCFVTVLGIALASYLAVSNQAMKLSNRSYLKSVSTQLAESGFEHALWTLNNNNWDPTLWTLDPVNHTATRVLPPKKYANGVVGHTRILVKDYDATGKATPWSPSVSYPTATTDVISYNGPSPWDASASYGNGDIIVTPVPSLATYRCIQAHTGQPPPDPAYWKPLADTDVSDYRRWYRCIEPHSDKRPPDLKFWQPSTPIIYTEGMVVLPDTTQEVKTQLRGHISIAPLFPNALAAKKTLKLEAGGLVDSYNSMPDASPSAIAQDYDTSRRSFSAILVGANVSSTAVTITNATIYGFIAAPQNSPSFYSGGAGSIKGSVTGSGIDLTRVSRSPHIPQADQPTWVPIKKYRLGDVVFTSMSNSRFYASNVDTDSNNLNRALSSSWYWKRSITTNSIPSSLGSEGGPIELRNFPSSLNLTSDLTINGPVILNIRGDISIPSGRKIRITQTGSAEIHFSGQLKVDVSGEIENATKDPKKLLLVRLSNSTPTTGHYFNSENRFYGAIYMPNSSISVGPNAQIFGAISANNITFPGDTTVHYDTSLRTTSYRSIETIFTITDWRELTDPAEQVTFP